MDESLMISGTWVNKNTGEQVTIHNSVIDGDEMILMTDKGQLTMTEFSANYIQVSNEVYDNTGKVIGNESVNISDIIPQKTELTIKPDFGKSISSSNSTNTKKETIQTKNNEPESFKILEKFFNKVDVKNLISIDINFEILPKHELNTIIEYLDIKIEDIAEYLNKKIKSDKLLSDIIFNKLQKYINNV